MRKTSDRIRHAISFEVLALLIVTPMGAWLFDKPLQEIGVVTVVSASIATAWNYVYNLGFDHAMQRLRGTVQKTVPIRVLHAVTFEVGLLFVLMPFIAWYLGVSLMEAFLIDVSFAVFYLIYAFVFNWVYDVVFPVPETAPQS
jgi:uncharacterized membrane protein